MKSSKESKAKDELAWRFLDNLIFNKSPVRISAGSLIDDGRSRDRIFTGLLRDGYLTDYQEEAGSAVITSKAFDELPTAAVDLAGMYEFRDRDSDQGKVWVVWDRLTIGQKKEILIAVEMDPDSYTLMMVESRLCDPRRISRFALGGGVDAVQKVGGWGSFLFCVCNDAVRQKDAECRRASMKAQLEETSLTWFLQQQKIISSEEVVPILEQMPMPCLTPKLTRRIERWPDDLPRVIDETVSDIKTLQERLIPLTKFQQAVIDGGGWDAFMASYDAAIEKIIDAHMEEEATKAKQRSDSVRV